MTDPVKTAQNLIRCPSVTPKDEGALSVLIDILEPLGFECHNLPYENVPNLFARLGTGAPHICFCGHTDVVPAGDEANWRIRLLAARSTRVFSTGAGRLI